MADTQNQTNSDSNSDPNANQATQTDQAVAAGNAYELIKKRLTEQGRRIEQLTAKLKYPNAGRGAHAHPYRAQLCGAGYGTGR